MPPLPPPLPPAERTVGQLVAESIRLYGSRFWPSLALGAGPAAFTLGSATLDGAARLAFAFALGPPILSATYVAATVLATSTAAPARLLVATAAGIPAFLPFVAARVFLFPGAYLIAVAWFALTALAVPAVVVERRHLADALRRAVELGRADFVHAAGGVAALALMIAVCVFLLFFLLAGFGDQALPIAALLAVFVAGPLFFLGAALLYFDQAARAERRR